MTLPTIVWTWVPVAGLALGVSASLALMITAKWVRPTKVEEHPYLASAHYDADKERSAAAVRAGLRLVANSANGQLVLRVEHPVQLLIPGPATIALWRPDDAALDTTRIWPDPTQAISLPEARRGHWRISVELPCAQGWPDGAHLETRAECP